MNRNRAKLLGMLMLLQPDVKDAEVKAQIEEALRNNGVQSVEDLQRMYRGA